MGPWLHQCGVLLNLKHRARQLFVDVPNLKVSNLRFIFVHGLCMSKIAACMQGVVDWKPLLERDF